MKQTGKVIEIIDDNTVRVECDRQSACSMCDNASSCVEKCQKVYATARNTVGAVVGDTVEIEADTAVFLRNSVALFIIPTVLSVVLYFVFNSFLGEGLSVLFTMMVLILGMAVIAFLLNNNAKKDSVNKIFRIIR